MTGQISDETLMARVQRGDHDAFAVLVRRHAKLFFAAAYRMCGQAQEAEDVVQDAFLKLWQNPQLWNPAKGAKFTTWFYRVVANQAIDGLRKKKPLSSAAVLDLLSDGRPDAEGDFIERQDAAHLERAIQSLPERQKMALNLCFYEGLSNREAAAIIGVGVKALESLLIRAKSALRKELALMRQEPLSKTNAERRPSHARSV